MAAPDAEMMTRPHRSANSCRMESPFPRAGRLLEKLLYGIRKGVAAVNDTPGLVDDDADRDPGHLVPLRDRAVGIEENGIPDAQGPDRTLYPLRAFLHVDRHDLHVPPAMDFVHGRDIFHADRAPRCPEKQQDRLLPDEVPEGDRDAVGVPKGEIHEADAFLR